MSGWPHGFRFTFRGGLVDHFRPSVRHAASAEKPRPPLPPRSFPRQGDTSTLSAARAAPQSLAPCFQSSASSFARLPLKPLIGAPADARHKSPSTSRLFTEG